MINGNADRNLLFGLLGLQIGLIDQWQLVAAFQAWTRDKGRPLAEHLIARGALDADDRAAVEALVVRHLRKHGGDPERSLAAIPAGRSTRESLARLAHTGIEASIAHPGAAATQHDEVADRTASYSVGSSTSDGQRFRILRPHARGGLGAVFVALDGELHREVALKQILDQHADDAISRQRFLLEAEVTGGLEHPGIVPVYGLGTYGDGRPYYAMRFIRGDSLKEAIKRFRGDEGLKADPGRRSLELRTLLRRFTDVCNAIGYAHSRGVLHRDIKPGNIIVGKHGETLVVDWGLAKATGKSDASAGERTLRPSSASGSSETLPGSALGTPGYMSPEQARGELDRLGSASDVYGLGATLYCLLTGRPPFAGDDVGAVLRAVRRGEFTPPARLDPTVDRGLEAICLKAMALEPGDRYASSRALAEDIERWMADEPVSAWREPLLRRARRWARRNRTAVTAAIATVLASTVGLGVVLAVETRANRDLTRANEALAQSIARERKSNADLEAANERERQRFDLAVEAVRRYHTDVSEDFLLKQDQFKELRDRLLRDAFEYYRKLEGLLSAQGDARSRRALGRAYEEVGSLAEKIGSVPEALESHRKALEVRRELAREPSADVVAKSDVGRSLILIGILLDKTGRYDPARASYEEARSVLGKLVGPHPARNAILGDIARSYYWTGWMHHQTGMVREALAAYEEGRAIEAELTAAHPDAVDDVRLLSWCYNNIGMLLSDQGKLPEALAAHLASRRIKQKIADDHPDVAEYRRDLAISHSIVGISLARMGDMHEALVAHEASVQMCRELADSYPAVSQLKSDLANSLTETGDVLWMEARTAEARTTYEQALEILRGLVRKNATITEHHERSIQALKGLGAVQSADHQIADAAATWREAVAMGENLNFLYYEPLYHLAGCRALLGRAGGEPGAGISAEEGRVELDRAMDTLRRAVAAGYHCVPWMRRDPSLDPLRSRPDFQLLMRDLAFPADPFAPDDLPGHLKDPNGRP